MAVFAALTAALPNLIASAAGGAPGSWTRMSERSKDLGDIMALATMASGVPVNAIVLPAT